MTLDTSDQVFIWSAEHNAYWRPNGNGYTRRIGGAGLYDRVEAEEILRGVGPEKRLVIEELPPWARALEAEVYNRAIEDAAKVMEIQIERSNADFETDEGQIYQSGYEQGCDHAAAAIRALAKTDDANG